jgi:8-oxo-dGTP diphosphatase
MDRPGVGVAVIIRDENGRILLGKRKNVLNAGLWSLPGGHLEWMEDFEACCRREVKEEVGIEISYPRKVAFSNDRFYKDNRHYITLFFLAEWAGGQVVNAEPDKCYGWEWFDPWSLPDPVWDSVKLVVGELEAEKRQHQLDEIGEDCEDFEDEEDLDSDLYGEEEDCF